MSRDGSACQRRETELTLAEAHSILEPFFRASKQLFVDLGLSRLSRTRFEIDSGLHDTPRHFAACTEDGRTVFAAPELADMPFEFVVGIFAHECGHAADFLYPGEFALGAGKVIRRELDGDAVSDTQRIRWMKAWEARDADVVELTADGIAEQVWGKPIGYGGPCLLQNFRSGPRRPKGLR